MRSVYLCSALALGALLPGPAAHAQARFRVGPQAGAGLSFSPYYNRPHPFRTLPLLAAEAGVAGAWAVGPRVTLRPALLFAQRGFRVDDINNGNGSYQATQVRLRLNYLRFPVTVAYALRAGGRRVQVLGGVYAGLLLGGSCEFNNTYGAYRIPTSTVAGTMTVAGSGRYSSSRRNDFTYWGTYTYTGGGPSPETYYSRRVDAGVQVGLGYRLGNALLRVDYSLGLLNLGVGSRTDYGGTVGVRTTEPANYLNQAVVLSTAYLFSFSGED